MNILHIAPISFNKASGLSYSIPSLVSAQNKLNNVTATLLLSSDIDYISEKFDFPIFMFKKHNIRYDLQGLPDSYKNPNLVVFHSTYIPVHMKIANQLNKKDIPYIIVPRGGMTKGAQQKKVIKKKIGNLICYNKFVKNSLALHCLTKGEAEETRQWNKKMFIVGNGMNIPNENDLSNPGKNNDIKFTFIGRLDSYHKGLDLLLDSIAIISDKIREGNGKFSIYGPDSEESKKILEKQIKNHNIQDIVNIYGPVFDEDKKQVLKGTDVFVHTSRFEGHPMSVLEAMSYGIPCLVTPGTNVSKEVSEANAGWEVQLSATSIANGIKKVLEYKNELESKGTNARKLIIDKYSWDKIAMQTVENYYSILS